MNNIEILANVKNAVQDFNNGGKKSDFYNTILNAVNAVGIEHVVKATNLTRVEIYDTLDGVSPSFENLSRILEVFGVKITLNFNENAVQLKDFIR